MGVKAPVSVVQIHPSAPRGRGVNGCTVGRNPTSIGSSPFARTRNLRGGVRFPTWNGCIMGTGYDAGGGAAMPHSCQRSSMVEQVPFKHLGEGSTPSAGTIRAFSTTGGALGS